MNNNNKVMRIAGWILLGAAAVLIISIAAMYLWNWLVPSLFNGPHITLTETIGLLLLLKIFAAVTGVGCHRFGHGGAHRRSEFWKRRWEQKMEGMSEEEKLRFKEMYYRRCGPVLRCDDTTEPNSH